jgi:hypothetical protein
LHDEIEIAAADDPEDGLRVCGICTRFFTRGWRKLLLPQGATLFDEVCFTLEQEPTKKSALWANICSVEEEWVACRTERLRNSARGSSPVESHRIRSRVARFA